MARTFFVPSILLGVMVASLPACAFFVEEKPRPRLAMFIGVDISGSFMRGAYFDDSLRFVAHYIYCHLKGFGGLEVPRTLFVGSIGGAKPDEPKTFYPIQTFEGKSVEEITLKLREIFPKSEENPYTDFNAYFQQVAVWVRNKNLVLRPISIVMVSDGIPDVMRQQKRDKDFRKIVLKPLENLSRNVSVRLLYTDAQTGIGWQNKVPRRRVKVWTQDAEVMKDWKAVNVIIPGIDFSRQERFFAWISDNVDFKLRSRRVR